MAKFSTYIFALLLFVVFTDMSAQTINTKKKRKAINSLVPKKFRNEVKDTLPSSLSDFDDYIIDYVGNHRDGDNVLIDFMITNRGARDGHLNLSTRYGIVTGVSGTSYIYDFKSGAELFDQASYAFEDFTYPSGVTKKVTLIAHDVPTSECGFARVALSRGERHLPFSLDSLAISDPVINTNFDNLSSSKAGVVFNLLSCTRSGKNVLLDFTLTSDEDISLCPSSILVYDNCGNQYTSNLLSIGNKTLSSGRKPSDKSAVILRNTPVNCRLTINGYPYGSSDLTLAKIVYSVDRYSYYLEVRNQKIK